MSLPARLFRFFGPTDSSLLTTQRLWVSAVSDFNDVFEVVPRYDEFVETEYSVGLRRQFDALPPDIRGEWPDFKAQMGKLMSEAIDDDHEIIPQRIQDHFRASFGIICFSTELDSLLMWGHYTRSHKGFVVEFDPHHSLFHPLEFGKVDYSQTRPVFETAAARKMLLVKGKEWEYENEYRLIKSLSKLDRAVKEEEKQPPEEKHFVQLPLDAVKAVYVGLKMPRQKYTEILTSIKLPGREHISAYAMRRHRQAYALKAIPWKPPAFAVKTQHYETVWTELLS